MIDFNNKSVFKLKPNDAYQEHVSALLLEGEEVLGAFSSMRDGVVLTDKRLIVVNVQGITGSKRDFSSLPYSTITAFSVETAGTLDLDAELELYFTALGKVRLEFSGRVNVAKIARVIGGYML